MPTYITLYQYTQQGIQNIRESPNRLDKARELIRSMGAELKQFYLVNGRYDIVTVGEAPDDETETKVALAIASAGNVRTETLRAYTEEQYRRIIADLP